MNDIQDGFNYIDLHSIPFLTPAIGDEKTEKLSHKKSRQNKNRFAIAFFPPDFNCYLIDFCF